MQPVDLQLIDRRGGHSVEKPRRQPGSNAYAGVAVFKCPFAVVDPDMIRQHPAIHLAPVQEGGDDHVVIRKVESQPGRTRCILVLNEVHRATVRIVSRRRCMHFSNEFDLRVFPDVCGDVVELQQQRVVLMPEGEELVEVRARRRLFAIARPADGAFDSDHSVAIVDVADRRAVFRPVVRLGAECGAVGNAHVRFGHDRMGRAGIRCESRRYLHGQGKGHGKEAAHGGHPSSSVMKRLNGSSR